MTDPVRIRRATAADAALAAPLFDGYRRFYHQPADEAGARRFLADRLAAGESVVFLATLGDQGTPVGFMQLYPVFSSIGLTRALILNDLFVAPEARGRGVARALLTEAATYGRATGARSLELATHHENHAAQQLYQALGWVREESFLHYELAL